MLSEELQRNLAPTLHLIFTIPFLVVACFIQPYLFLILPAAIWFWSVWPTQRGRVSLRKSLPAGDETIEIVVTFREDRPATSAEKPREAMGTID